MTLGARVSCWMVAVLVARIALGLVGEKVGGVRDFLSGAGGWGDHLD